ncbi:hypothetical protein EP331_11055 [bacterium]|nr:MAG: hypothetical protein EP331_11055 [bacterium]
MKKGIQLLVCLLFMLIPFVSYAQSFDPEKTYVITKSDKSTFIGKIISDDTREVIIFTEDLGQIAIPKYMIESIKEYTIAMETKKKQEEREVFATRYFITTNALPIEKGDSYYQFSLVGPDIQFGVKKNFGVGFITSWLGNPFIGTMKYTGNINENVSYAIGGLFGASIWDGMNQFRFALPYTALTFGDESSNLNFALGFGTAKMGSEVENQWMFSVGALKKITRNGTLVFDSMIFPTKNKTVWLLVPGFRIQTNPNSAFQFGFPGIITTKESDGFGFPMISWFRKF